MHFPSLGLSADPLQPAASLPKSLIVAAASGLVYALVFKLTLPPEQYQIINNYSSALEGAAFPVIIVSVIFLTLLLSLAGVVVMRFGLKYRETLHMVWVAFVAVFLALILERSMVVGDWFVWSLPVMFAAVELLWHVAKRWLTTQILFAFLLVPLFMWATYVLNTGRFI